MDRVLAVMGGNYPPHHQDVGRLHNFGRLKGKGAHGKPAFGPGTNVVRPTIKDQNRKHQEDPRPVSNRRQLPQLFRIKLHDHDDHYGPDEVPG